MTSKIGESTIELGATYKDSVTGFEGIATQASRFLFACERVYLSQGVSSKTGKDSGAAFDAAQLLKTADPTPEVKKAQAKAAANGVGGTSDIELGAKYKDSISGFTGVAVVSSRSLFACEQVRLSKGHAKEDAKEISHTFDSAQLVRVSGISASVKKALKAIGIEAPAARPKVAAKTGGYRPTPSADR